MGTPIHIDLDDVGTPMSHEALGRLLEHRDVLARKVADAVVDGREPEMVDVVAYAAARATADWELTR